MNRTEYPITTAVRFLRERNVEFAPHLYQYQEHGGTRVGARELGFQEHILIKTLVMETDRRQPLIVLMHGDCEVSTATASTINWKGVRMRFCMCVVCGLALAFACANLVAGVFGADRSDARVQRKTCLAPDGVTIVYSAAGAGETALVFVHGGLADRSFYDGQLRALAGRFRVIALDLAGHGESGVNRKKWGLPEFGADIKAVVVAEKLKRAILFGNSLGGPAVVEAALVLPGTVVGVVGIDTFQRLDTIITADETRQRAEAFRADYAGSMKAMVKALFHADTNPALVAETERRMMKTSPDAAYAIFLGMAGYDVAASARRLAVPLRAINGDLYETDVQGNRKIVAGFDAVIMKHVGHYPMLEKPDEFNRNVAGIVDELLRK